jgi:hypothetical protein
MADGHLTRRELLALAAASGVSAAVGPRVAQAIGPTSKFRFAQLDLGAGTNPRPSAVKRLTWELAKRTSIEVTDDRAPLRVGLDADKLAESPLLYLAGDREFPIPPPSEIAVLRRYLEFGGFLIIDSAEGSAGGAFDGSVRQLIDALFPHPQPGIKLLPADHVVYNSFYLLRRPLGRLDISPTLEGVFRDDRAVIAYCQNDLGGAWQRDDMGNFEFVCEPGGERQRELAFRLGVNLVMYALCLDYKSDQVHVPFIMRRRRWRPEDGAEEQ